MADAMTVSPFFLLYDSEASLLRVMAEAALWRISIRDEGAKSNVSNLDKAEEMRSVVHAIRCPSEQRSLRLNELRSEYPTAGIIVLADGVMAGPERVSLLFSGADACFDESVLPMEVIASLQTLSRRGYAFMRGSLERAGCDVGSRHRMVFDSSNKRWELKGDGRLLLTPSGREVGLTPTERHVMQVLMANSPHPVERKGLVIKSRPGEIGRYLDVQISRIKQKLLVTGERLPIASVRGYGYAFVGDCIASSENPLTS